MKASEVKNLMRAAGTTINKLDRKIGRHGWEALTDAEKAADLAYQQYRIATAPKSWGEGRLVATPSGPLAWFEIDTRIKGGCRHPEWK